MGVGTELDRVIRRIIWVGHLPSDYQSTPIHTLMQYAYRWARPLLAALFLGDRLRAGVALGGLCILTGAVLAQWKGKAVAAPLEL